MFHFAPKNFIKHTLFGACVLFFVLTACEKGNKFLLNKKEMENLLVDIHLLDAGIGKISDTTLRINNYSNAQAVCKEIFLQHKTTPRIFDSSLTYYSTHPKELNEIYDGVIQKLKEIEANAPLSKEDMSDKTIKQDSVPNNRGNLWWDSLSMRNKWR